jgi:hypothetical protein
VKSVLAGPAAHNRAPLRRIRLQMPNALWLAAAGQYPKAEGRRGMTHPRVTLSAVRDWLGAMIELSGVSDCSDIFVPSLQLILPPHASGRAHHAVAYRPASKF